MNSRLNSVTKVKCTRGVQILFSMFLKQLAVFQEFFLENLFSGLWLLINNMDFIIITTCLERFSVYQCLWIMIMIFAFDYSSSDKKLRWFFINKLHVLAVWSQGTCTYSVKKVNISFFFRFDDSPFGLSSESRYSNNWGSSSSSSMWDNEKFDKKSTSTVIEDIPSKTTNNLDTW